MAGEQTGSDQAVRGVLHAALSEAVERLHVVTAVVYLLTEDGTELWAAMIGGYPPSVFTLPGRMALDAPYEAARALSSEEVTVVVAPEPAGADAGFVPIFPYVVASAPVVSAKRRIGALTVLRLETQDPYDEADCKQLRHIADRLAVALTALAEKGERITPGVIPVMVPLFYRPDTDADMGESSGWGVPSVPGSVGMSLMYPLRRVADMLNEAKTIEEVNLAAEFYVMAPFQAQSLVLASVGEGRLWVMGFSGASSDTLKTLHGIRVHTPTPAAQAVRGRPIFVPATDTGAGEQENGEADAGAYLPLIGSNHVIGVCCLYFDGPRRFSPEEKAVLTMMASLIGSAVERVELGRKRHALAESLQKRLLPPILSDLPQMTTTARYRPATATSEVGGDWYDVIKVPGERIMLVVGDVEGHAVESTVFMGQVRSAVIAYAMEGHRPAAVIDRTGRLIAELGSGLLVTCCVVLFDPTDGVAEVCLAGHPEPLVHRPDGSIDTLHAPPNVPLGITSTASYQAWEHILDPGSILLLYSDGLADPGAPDPVTGASDLFSSSSRAAGANLEVLADHLVADLPALHQRRDDAVLLLARYEGADGKDIPDTASLNIQRHDLSGVKTARTFVDAQLRTWDLSPMADDLQLIISEVVTNALIHAGSDVDVRLRAFTDHLRLEVRDSDSNPPIPSPLSLSDEGLAEAEHGRGLFIVEALAREWNSSPSGRGKTVWVELAIPDI